MTDNDETRVRADKEPDSIERATLIIDQIRPILSGVDPDAVGAALCELVATFIAGHHPVCREEMADLFFDTVRKLVEPCVEEMIATGRTPENWKGSA